MLFNISNWVTFLECFRVVYFEFGLSRFGAKFLRICFYIMNDVAFLANLNKIKD